MPQQPSLARQQVMRLAGCGPYLAIRYGGRAARRVRHLVADGGPSPRPIKRLQLGSKLGNVRWMGNCPSPRGLAGGNGAPSSASCMKGGSLSGTGSSFRWLAPHAPRRDCCVNCPTGRDSAQWGCSRGRFERAATSHPDSNGGVRGDEVCGRAGRESRRDMVSYDTVHESKSFPMEPNRSLSHGFGTALASGSPRMTLSDQANSTLMSPRSAASFWRAFASSSGLKSISYLTF